MSVIALQVFVSLMLVAGSLVLFLFSARQRDFEHADRLALAPLDADTGAVNPTTATTGPETPAAAPAPKLTTTTSPSENAPEE